MARVLNEQEYAKKRKEILDTTQKLIYTVGFEQMTIQHVLDELQMSKGAFYHYFKSKQDLLESLILYMVDAAMVELSPIADDPALTGLAKLNRFFDAAATWKSARKPFFLALVRSWYSDDNIVVREKTQSASIKGISPMLNRIVAQAVREGSVHTPYPEFAAEIIFTIFQGLGDTLIKHILSPDDDPDFERLLNAYTCAIQRVLGVEADQLRLVDMDMIREWEINQ